MTVKEDNLIAVLHALLRSFDGTKGVTRAVLAAETGLSLMTVGKAADALIETGLFVQHKVVDGSIGRRTSALFPSDSMGLELSDGENRVTVGISLVSEMRVKTNRSGAGQEKNAGKTKYSALFSASVGETLGRREAIEKAMRFFSRGNGAAYYDLRDGTRLNAGEAISVAQPGSGAVLEKSGEVRKSDITPLLSFFSGTGADAALAAVGGILGVPVVLADVENEVTAGENAAVRLFAPPYSAALFGLGLDALERFAAAAL